MNKRKLWTLIAGAGLAAMALLLVFLLLGRNTVGAAPSGDSATPNLRSPSATFTVSGTVTCKATGPISDVEVSVWNQVKSTVVASDTTDSRGVYSMTLDGGTCYVEFIPPAAAGLNAKAFTTIELITDTILNAEFCLCSGVWVSETVDSAGDLGGSTSLVLAPTYPYAPQISYHDVTSDNLKYAWLSGNTWLSETVDSGGGWTSLALVPTYPYTACITYYDGASPNFWEWFLKHACRDGISWTITAVNSFQRAGQGGVSLALEPTYPFTPHISYNMPWGTERTLYHAYLSGTTWMSGTWVYEKVEPSLSEVGWFNSLALESNHPYTPHISYYDYANDDLRHAWRSGTAWLSETVDSVGDVGWYTSLALDSNNDPHISYFDNTNDALKYVWWSGTTWLSETVDSTGQPNWGRGTTSLELDGANRPYVSYYDATDGNLKLARLDGRVWIIQPVDSEGDVGQFSSLALDGFGCPHISYYDATNQDLKYAYIPPHYVYLPLVMRNYP